MLKNLLETLIETLLGLCVQKTEAEWIAHQGIPQTGYVEYDVTSGSSTAAPFDGVACLFVDGASQNVKNGRISSRSVYASVYASGDLSMRYFRQWVPICKGSPIGVQFEGGSTAVLRCIPTIGSGDVIS